MVLDRRKITSLYQKARTGVHYLHNQTPIVFVASLIILVTLIDTFPVFTLILVVILTVLCVGLIVWSEREQLANPRVYFSNNPITRLEIETDVQKIQYRGVLLATFSVEDPDEITWQTLAWKGRPGGMTTWNFFYQTEGHASPQGAIEDAKTYIDQLPDDWESHVKTIYYRNFQIQTWVVTDTENGTQIKCPRWRTTVWETKKFLWFSNRRFVYQTNSFDMPQLSVEAAVEFVDNGLVCYQR